MLCDDYAILVILLVLFRLGFEKNKAGLPEGSIWAKHNELWAIVDDEFNTSLMTNTIPAKLPNESLTVPTDRAFNTIELQSEDDVRSGCQNVSNY